jgi:catechol 2,3-dioxygenase-like lactoylglutathione lyase family enzyme
MRMLEASKVAARIPVQDLQRARSFYAEKLGLEPSVELPGGLLYRCGEGEFGLFESAGAASGDHTQMSWRVEDIETIVEWLRARGVVFEEYDFPGLRTVNGIAEVRDSEGNLFGKGAWFRDSESNVLGINRPTEELRRTMLGPDPGR